MEGHSHFVKTMKQSEFIKHNISSKNNLYVEAKEVGVEIYCFWEKLMEFITYNNVSARHILLRNPCNHNGGTR